MKIIIGCAIVLFMTVWTMGVAWQVGYFKWLGRPLRWKRNSSPRSDSTGKGNQADQRCDFTHVARRLLLHAILCGVGLLIGTALCVAVAMPLGLGYVAGGLAIVFLIVFFVQTRLETRYLMQLVSTTP